MKTPPLLCHCSVFFNITTTELRSFKGNTFALCKRFRIKHRKNIQNHRCTHIHWFNFKGAKIAISWSCAFNIARQVTELWPFNITGRLPAFLTACYLFGRFWSATTRRRWLAFIVKELHIGDQCKVVFAYFVLSIPVSPTSPTMSRMVSDLRSDDCLSGPAFQKSFIWSE